MRRRSVLFRQCGFTMMELIIVAAIVSILAALSFPFGREFLSSASLRSSAREVASSILRAKTEAIKINAPVAFEFTSSGYSAERVSGGVLFSGNIDDGISYQWDSDTRFVGDRIEFGNLGTASGFQAGENQGSVAVTNGSRAIVVTVSRSGRVFIE